MDIAPNAGNRISGAFTHTRYPSCPSLIAIQDDDATGAYTGGLARGGTVRECPMEFITTLFFVKQWRITGSVASEGESYTWDQLVDTGTLVDDEDSVVTVTRAGFDSYEDFLAGRRTGETDGSTAEPVTQFTLSRNSGSFPQMNLSFSLPHHSARYNYLADDWILPLSLNIQIRPDAITGGTVVSDLAGSDTTSATLFGVELPMIPAAGVTFSWSCTPETYFPNT